MKPAGPSAAVNEADLLGVRLVPVREARLPRDLAHLRLRQLPEREAGDGELLRGQVVEKVRLVLAEVARLQQPGLSRRGVGLDPRVVPRGDRLAAEGAAPCGRGRRTSRRCCTRGTGPGVSPARYDAHERPDDRLEEAFRQVEGVVRDPDRLGGPPRGPRGRPAVQQRPVARPRRRPGRGPRGASRRPTTSAPCLARRSAATEESTPPDMATAIRIHFGVYVPGRPPPRGGPDEPTRPLLPPGEISEPLDGPSRMELRRRRPSA